MFGLKSRMITADEALKGRTDAIPTETTHFVLKTPLKGPYPAGSEQVVFAMGCFWGVERLFWQVDGVYVTAAGYIGGYTPNPTYKEVCSGQTGHTEGVLVVYDPKVVSFEALMKLFWERHDPTQGYRQGNDVGTQYRSAVYYDTDVQKAVIESSKAAYQAALNAKGLGQITSEILPLLGDNATAAESGQAFYFAEDYHQGYLAKNPDGYCGLKGTGAVCAI
jgi:peptide-methionine (S)-S-oxide reductase